jgi:deazaflavin-dependent oxidoreductase (nitroreductase family)
VARRHRRGRHRPRLSGEPGNGAPEHPVRVHNLRKEPHVELQDGPARHGYLTHEAEGDERALWWERAVAAYPPYADHQLKTERVIPVFVLTRLLD